MPGEAVCLRGICRHSKKAVGTEITVKSVVYIPTYALMARASTHLTAHPHP